MKGLFYLLTACSVFLTGCQVSSRISMYGSGGRTSYNAAAQNTTNQELLLNLVRLRYSDTPYFLELNGITTQFNFSTKIAPSIKIPGFDDGNPASIGGELGWSNQPTIQYSPLEGKDFAIQMMQPLDLRMVQGLIFMGWDVDRIFRLLIQNMANVPNAIAASGPIPQSPPHYQKFLECLELLKYFHERGELQIGVRFMPHDNRNMSEEDACNGAPNAIQISFPVNGQQSERLADLLEEGVKKTKGRYVLNMRQAFNEEASLGLMTRSLLSAMYYLSLGVNVPPKDIYAGTVAITQNQDGSLFDWHQVIGDLFTINWSYRKPDYAYLAVPYRGYWFYIDDSDVSTKRTFVLLQQIYNLQAKQQEKEGPLLTIPLISGR